jgi:hypothetical protein
VQLQADQEVDMIKVGGSAVQQTDGYLRVKDHLGNATATAAEQAILEQAISDCDEHRCRANVGYDGSRLTVNAWLEHRGEAVGEPTSARVTVYDDGGTEQFELSENEADAQGVFKMVKVGPGLGAGKSYYAKVEIESGGETHVTVEGISTL